MAPQKPPAKKAERLPPCPLERYAEIGMIVVHYPDLAHDARPALAIVTAIGMECLDLLVFHPGMSGGYPNQGVFHRDLQADRITTDGYWLPRADDVLIRKLLIREGYLEWDGESKYVPTTKAEVTPTPPSSSTAAGAATTPAVKP